MRIIGFIVENELLKKSLILGYILLLIMDDSDTQISAYDYFNVMTI
jgi:hypothetical protein